MKIGPDHKSTNINVQTYTQFIADFIRNGWNESDFTPYYKASKKLYTSAIWIPTTHSENTAAEMHLENELTPTLWIGWYRAQVTAPKSGKFHFVGFGDDTLVVAINGKVVFDQGSSKPAPWYNLDWNHFRVPPGWGRFHVGDTFEVNNIESMKMDVLWATCLAAITTPI